MCVVHVCVYVLHVCMFASVHSVCNTNHYVVSASYHIPNQFSWKSTVPQNTFSHNLVERVKWNVNRDSPEDKLRDFMEWMKAVKKETGHQV